MKLVKIIAVATIAITLTVQAAQAGSLLTGSSSGSTGSSLLTGTSGSSGSLLGNIDSTSSSLLRTYEDKDIYDSSGNQMSCYTDSYGNTICE